MKVWNQLSLEQYVVMTTAYNEAYLNNVMDDYSGLLKFAKTGGRDGMSTLGEESKQRLIPHFANVVADMIARNWIEIREPRTGRWDDAEPMTPEQIRAALTDPASWIARLDGSHRMVMLMRTDDWDRLVEEDTLRQIRPAGIPDSASAARVASSSATARPGLPGASTPSAAPP